MVKLELKRMKNGSGNGASFRQDSYYDPIRRSDSRIFSRLRLCGDFFETRIIEAHLMSGRVRHQPSMSELERSDHGMDLEDTWHQCSM